MTKRINQVLTQKLPFGNLSISICEKEAIALRLLYVEEEMIDKLWWEFWQGVCSYDDLPPACRQLMPIIVGRMLECAKAATWERVNNVQLGFLRGLPKYTWAKNALISTSLEKIARACLLDPIPIIAIKGASEFLARGKDAKFRPTIDIDIMVRPHDVEKFSKAVNNIGYCAKKYKRRTVVESAIPQSYIQYQNEAPGFPEIDLHLKIDDEIDQQIQLCERIWMNRLQCDLCSNLYIPSPGERYEISLINAFRLGNWASHAYLKYIYDVISLERNYPACPQVESKMEPSIRVDASLVEWQYQIKELGHALGILKSIANETRQVSFCGGQRINILSISVNGSLANATLNYIKTYIAEIHFGVYVQPSLRSIYRVTLAPLLIIILILKQEGIYYLLNKLFVKKYGKQRASVSLPRVSWSIGKL
jgi:hypothetical protein